MRILDWMIRRVRSRAGAVESPIGWMPTYDDINWEGLDFSREQFDEIMDIDREAWKQEVLGHEALFEKMYDKLPKEFTFMRELLLSSLWRSPEKMGISSLSESDGGKLIDKKPAHTKPTWDRRFFYTPTG